MTVATAYTPLTYAGNGATTAFAVTWPFLTGSLVVTLIAASGTRTLQTLTTHYTVSGGTDADGLPATGTVTMITAPATGASLEIVRATPRTQGATWASNDAFPEKVVEGAFDKQLLIAQEAAYAAENPVTDIAFAVGTVTTGAAGSSAAVTVTESPANTFTLGFTIPRGDTGGAGAGTGDLLSANNLSDLANATTARTNLGLGTAANPQFASLEVGHASDTTLTRTGAGDIAVEGNAVYRASGTDVPVADGGTGASTAAGAATNLGLGTADSPQFTAVNVGHASDTTVTRGAAGQLDVEGSRVWQDNNVGARINALGTVTPDSTADYVALYDDSGGIAGKALWPDNSVWVEIGDTTIGAPVGSVEHTWTAGTYSEVLVVVSDVSPTTTALLEVSLRNSGGAIVTSTHGGTSFVAANVGTTRVVFAIGLDAATKSHVIFASTVSISGVADTMAAAVGSNATAPDRIRVAFSAGNIDDGRIITYGLKV